MDDRAEDDLGNFAGHDLATEAELRQKEKEARKRKKKKEKKRREREKAWHCWQLRQVYRTSPDSSRDAGRGYVLCA
jgi:hypothetical protein